VNVEIAYLADRPEAIDIVTRWLYDEFSYLVPGKTVGDVKVSLMARMNRDVLPLSIVASDGGEVAGTASLKLGDMDTRDDLSPWLAGLYVDRTRRNRGVGTLLVKSIQEIARQFGYGELYLYTPGASGFYHGIGWKTLEEATYKSRKVVIMNYAL
jgi:predicted N-acetyltransferase YhbS